MGFIRSLNNKYDVGFLSIPLQIITTRLLLFSLKRKLTIRKEKKSGMNKDKDNKDKDNNKDILACTLSSNRKKTCLLKIT